MKFFNFNHVRLSLFVLIVAVFTGCVSVVPPSQQLSDLKTEEVKNYKLNEEYSVNVGDPVIVRRSYLYKIAEKDDRAVASKDFKLTIKLALMHDISCVGRKDEELLVEGTTTIKGEKYFIVKVGQINGSDVGALVDAITGQVSKIGVGQNAFGSWVTTAVSGVVSEPADVTFSPAKSIEIDQSKPYENYQIIYTGLSGENVTFVYREFTPDDLARPAFFQNLTYNLAESKVIQFRKLQMQVSEATNEGIKLKVLSDF
jgi:hypothetical protein